MSTRRILSAGVGGLLLAPVLALAPAAPALAIPIAFTSVGLTAPASLAVGGDPGAGSVTVTGNGSLPLGFVLSSSADLDPADLELTCTLPGGTSQDVDLQPAGTDLSGSCGSMDLTAGSTAAITIRATDSAPAGATVTVTAEVDDGSGSLPRDQARITLVAPTLSVSAPGDPVLPGDATSLSGAVSNAAETSYSAGEEITLPFTITGPAGFDATDLALRYLDGGTYRTQAASGTGSVQGVYGPPNATYALAGNGQVQAPLRATFRDTAPAGDYTVTYSLTSANGAVLARDSATFALAGVGRVAAQVPADLGVYGDPVSYAVTTTGVNCAESIYRVHVSGDEDLASGDVTLEYLNSAGRWLPLTVRAPDGELDGTAPLEDTHARFRVAAYGHIADNGEEPRLTLTTLHVRTTVESAGTVCGTATDTDVVRLHLPSITFDLPTRIPAGVPTVFPATVANRTGSTYSGVIIPVLTELERDSIADGDVTLEYRDGRRYVPLPCEILDGVLACDSTEGAEAVIPSGVTGTQEFRLTTVKTMRPQQLAVTMGLVQDSADSPALAAHYEITDLVAAGVQARPNPPSAAPGRPSALPRTGAAGLVPTVITGAALLAVGAALASLSSLRRTRTPRTRRR